MNVKICIFDIDGVLNYYPECFIEYINECTGENFSDLSQMKHELSYARYKSLKFDYRASGYKENLAARPEAFNTLLELKSRGYYIIILSSRPIKEHNSLIMQTTNWLRKNGLIYDYLMFEEEKHLEVIQKFGNVEFVVEDNRFYANNIAKYSGVKVFLVDNKYNQGEIEQNILRIQNINEILKGV
jgi:uncharacterized HAD superfamily protein